MADVVAIVLNSPRGGTLRVEWDAATLSGRNPRSAEELAWRIDGEVDWDEIVALRIVSAALPDRRGLALAALRPAGATGHDQEVTAALLVADGATEPVVEPLLSVESSGDGIPLRLGLELRAGSDTMPLRVAADVTASSREREGERERIHAALEVRHEGKRSIGAYDVLRTARGATP